MKIERIDIGGFGRLEDYSLSLGEGLQVLYGQNEAGKTTLMSFLSMMFYGQQEAARALERNPRKKYQPWSGKPMEGAITFVWAGETYHLSKRFGRIPSQDEVALTKPATGEEISLAQGQEVGEYFFGIDLSAFQRSGFIGQVGTIDTGRGTDDIAEKLVQNLWESGDSEISQQAVFQRLEDAKYGLITRRGDQGLLIEKRERLAQLRLEQEQVRHELSQQEDTRQRYRAVEGRYQRKKELEEMIKGYEAVQRQQHLIELLELLQQRQQQMDLLFIQGFTEESVPQLLRALKENEREQERLEQSIQTLKESLAQEGSVLISPEEYQRFLQAEERWNKAQQMEEQWEQRIVPGVQRYHGLQKQQEALLPAVQRAEQEHQALLRQQEAQATGEKLEQILDQSREQQKLWQQREELWIQQLETQQEKAAEEEKRRIHPVFLSLGLLLAVLFAVLGTAHSPLWFTGEGIAIVLLVLSFALGKPSASTDGAPTAAEVYETQRQEYEAWTGQQEKERQALEEKITSYQRQLAQLPPSEGFDVDLAQTIETSARELHTLEKEWQALRNALDSQRQYVEQLTDSFAKGLPQGEQELIALQNDRQQKAQRVQAQREQLLREKGVLTGEEYGELYHTSENRRKIMEDIVQRQETVQALRQTFVKTLAPHTPVESYAQGLEALERLEEALQRYNTLHQRCLVKAQALGFSKVSQKIVTGAVEALEPAANAYNGQPIKELEEEHKALASEDTFAQLQELQKELRPPRRSEESLAREIGELSQQVETLEIYYQGIVLALSTLEKAQEEMRKTFGPLLNETAGEILGQITGDRYQTLLVDKEYQIQVKEGIHYRPWAYLSHGTVDQAYLALRLAIAQLIRPEKGQLPLLLDDILIQYDNPRAQRTLEFLHTYGEQNQSQILLFTCHQRMADFAKALEIPVTHLLA